MVEEEAGKSYDKTSFLQVLRGMPKIISQDSYFKQAEQLKAVLTTRTGRPVAEGTASTVRPVAGGQFSM